MDAFWAVPEWAPADESHVLGSSSVVTKIAYGQGSVTYSTFDNISNDVLRLSFAPDSVWSGGHQLKRLTELAGDAEGFTLDDKTHVLRIRHLSRDVDIQGKSDDLPILNVDFDNPHLGVRPELKGEYPSGVIDWGEGVWRTTKPGGLLSTFGIATIDTAAKSATFKFAFPRVFMRFDVYNPTDHEITLTVHAPEMQNVVFQVKPGQLQRLKTEWMNRASQVTFESDQLGALRFDNLGYSMSLWTSVNFAL